MMTQFSPLSRRIIAIGILVLMLLLLIRLLTPLASMMAESLSALEDSRFRLARVEAIRSQPAPSMGEEVPSDFYLIAASREIAADMLIATINAKAQQYEVRIDAIGLSDGVPGDAQRVDVSLTATGEQEKLLSFINDLEQARPLIRFGTWALASLDQMPGDGSTPVQLQFTGTAMAVWKPA